MSTHIRPHMNPRLRSGFTLLEVIVAMMVLSVGVLGMTSTTLVVSRQLTSAERQTRVAAAVESRFDRLRATPCALVSAGSAVSEGITETWTRRDTTRAIIVVDSVRWSVRGVQRVQVYESMIPCLANP